jgi:hypothetical protein
VPAVPAELLRGARRYRSTAVVRATRLARPYTWRTARGSALSARAGDWRLSDGVEEWTVEADIFARTYRRLPDGRFTKDAPVDAARTDRPLDVPTCEGVARAEAGDWVLRGVDGELWTVTDAYFRSTYTPEPGSARVLDRPRSVGHRPTDGDHADRGDTITMPTEPERTTEPAPSDETGDDYGYDLAHEVKDALKIPVSRRRSTATTGTGPPPDQDGDFGYDEAHEVRGS